MGRFLKRIQKEKYQIKINRIEGSFIKSSKENSRHIFLIIGHPLFSDFGYRSHVIEFFLPLQYPLHPPKVIFRNKILHPNVDFFGRPCIDILKDQWSPAFQLRTVILSLQTFIQVFTFTDPLNQRIRGLFQKERKVILKFCRMIEFLFQLKKINKIQKNS